MTMAERRRRLSGGGRFETFIGRRYIHSRSGNRFISFISLISMLGIAVGVAVLVVVLSVVNGFEQELRLRILSMTSHAAITAYEGGLEAWEQAAAQAQQDPRVLETAPFIEGEGMLVNGDRVSGVAVRGILPLEEQRVSGVADKMVSGTLADLQAGEYGIVLGSALAEVLDVVPGDKVILAVNQGIVTPAGLMPRLRRFRVTGVFSAGMYEYDRGTAFVHMADASRLFRLGDQVLSLIHI